MNSTPEWEVNEALSLHLYFAAEHVKAIRGRIGEMRNPPPSMDISPSIGLSAFLDELLMATDTLERLVGLYGVLKPALLAAYGMHYHQANPLIDHPTRRIVKSMLGDEEERGGRHSQPSSMERKLRHEPMLGAVTWKPIYGRQVVLRVSM